MRECPVNHHVIPAIGPGFLYVVRPTDKKVVEVTGKEWVRWLNRQRRHLSYYMRTAKDRKSGVRKEVIGNKGVKAITATFSPTWSNYLDELARNGHAAEVKELYAEAGKSVFVIVANLAQEIVLPRVIRNYSRQLLAWPKLAWIVVGVSRWICIWQLLSMSCAPRHSPRLMFGN